MTLQTTHFTLDKREAIIREYCTDIASNLKYMCTIASIDEWRAKEIERLENEIEKRTIEKNAIFAQAIPLFEERMAKVRQYTYSHHVAITRETHSVRRYYEIHDAVTGEKIPERKSVYKLKTYTKVFSPDGLYLQSIDEKKEWFLLKHREDCIRRIKDLAGWGYTIAHTDTYKKLFGDD